MAESKPPAELSTEQLDYLARQVNSLMLSEPRVWGEMRRVVLGRNVQMNNALLNTMSGMIVIGDDTFFGHNVCLLTGSHDYRKRGAQRQTAIPQIGRDIFIGRGVWISSNVTIIGPCSIGDDAVVAAGSLVLGGDLPGGYIYAGTPAKAIKAIDFEETQGDGA